MIRQSLVGMAAAGMALAIALIVAAPAIADPINVSATRGVQVGDLANGDFFGPGSPSTALGPFADAVSQVLGSNLRTTSAGQDSDIQSGTGLFKGMGFANVDFSVLDTDGVYATSFFDVFFDITANHNYSLTGGLDAIVDGGFGLAMFDLQGPTPLFFFANGSGATPLNSAGILAAGSYHLTAAAVFNNGGNPQPGVFMGGSSHFDVTFNVTPIRAIPEPETYAMMLAGLGLLGFVARRRKAA